jgi:2-phospho-L-lactate guanylyltransferase (CobY/MobA/RfbA family)
MAGASAIRDLLSLLHERWLDEGRKEVIKNMLSDIIDKMEDSINMEDLR